MSSPTLAMALAGIASLAFVVAIASLWGIVIPSEWWRPAALLGSISSIVLFAIYLTPLAILPLVAELAVLWGVLIANWTPETLTGS
jgi:hypothetical protein